MEPYVSFGPPTGGCGPLSVFMKLEVWELGTLDPNNWKWRFNQRVFSL